MKVPMYVVTYVVKVVTEWTGNIGTLLYAFQVKIRHDLNIVPISLYVSVLLSFPNCCENY